MLYEKCAKYADTFYAVFRVIVGLLFMTHGLSKFGFLGGSGLSGFTGFSGLPMWIAVIVALIETLGGLAILLGFGVRTASLLGAVVLIGALVTTHLPKLPWAQGGGELAWVYLAAFLVIHTQGAKKFSLEKLLFKKERY